MYFLIFKEGEIIFNIKKDKRYILYVNEMRKGGMLHLNVVGHSVGQNEMDYIDLLSTSNLFILVF